MSDVFRVEVKAVLTVKKIMGTGSVEVFLPPGSTVADLLNRLTGEYGPNFRDHLFDPDTARLWPHIHILVNGRHFAFTGRMLTELKDGDSVLIMPPAGGG